VTWVNKVERRALPGSIFSAFFRKGQVLETFRGNGVFQPAVDTAIAKLNKGDWVHLFGEGKVNQPGIEPTQPLLLRFKWGV
jgi:monolysocardiolipin acyltransferase